MPGPVSDSFNPDSVNPEAWRHRLQREGFKFFVLKAEDFLQAIDDCDLFDEMLVAHEQYRLSRGKPAANAYWVVNRDEPYAPLVRLCIEHFENVKLKPFADEEEEMRQCKALLTELLHAVKHSESL